MLNNSLSPNTTSIYKTAGRIAHGRNLLNWQSQTTVEYENQERENKQRQMELLRKELQSQITEKNINDTKERENLRWFDQQEDQRIQSDIQHIQDRYESEVKPKNKSSLYQTENQKFIPPNPAQPPPAAVRYLGPSIFAGNQIQVNSQINKLDALKQEIQSEQVATQKQLKQIENELMSIIKGKTKVKSGKADLNPEERASTDPYDSLNTTAKFIRISQTIELPEPPVIQEIYHSAYNRVQDLDENVLISDKVSEIEENVENSPSMQDSEKDNPMSVMEEQSEEEDNAMDRILLTEFDVSQLQYEYRSSPIDSKQSTFPRQD